jgi:hypothetical protein
MVCWAVHSQAALEGAATGATGAAYLRCSGPPPLNPAKGVHTRLFAASSRSAVSKVYQILTIQTVLGRAGSPHEIG